MKVFFCFVAAFTIMFSTGYLLERSTMGRGDSLKLAIRSQVKIMKHEGRYVLGYPDRRGDCRVMFDPDAQQVLVLDPLVFAAARSDQTALDWLRNQLVSVHPAISGALGGVTLGFTAKDLIANPNLLSKIKLAAKKKEVIAALLGSATGFLAGAAAARATVIPDIDSPEGLALVRDVKFWTDDPATLLFGHALKVIYRSHLVNEDDSIIADALVLGSLRTAVVKIQQEKRLTSAVLASLDESVQTFEKAFGYVAEREKESRDNVSSAICWGFGVSWGLAVLGLLVQGIDRWDRKRSSLRRATGGGG
jgi:hypothetical protein